MGLKFLGKKPPSTTHVEPDGSTNVEKHFCGALLEAAECLERQETVQPNKREQRYWVNREFQYVLFLDDFKDWLRVSAGQEVSE